MSQVTYEIIRKLFEIYPIILQTVLFLVLWNVFFRWEKGIWIVAGILAVMNICMGLWLEKPGVIRYTMSAVIMDVGSVYGSYYETAKSYMGLRKEEKQARFAEKVTDKSQVSPEDMTLEEYKAYFNEKMNSLYTHPSQRNRNDIIDITDAAYKRMQTDPEYEKKILDALAKNKAVNFGNYIPQISYMHIDDTYEKCYGYTQGMKENDGYSGSSSAKETDAGRQKKARQKELLEEYLEKRAQMKEFQQEALEEKIAKQELERSRLTKAWSSKRQMAAATNAYESNVMTETSTGSNSLLG